MPMIEHHAPGSPCWLDLQTVNQADAVEFYGKLFGWKFRNTAPGAYTMAFRYGLPVAGFVQQAPDLVDDVQGATWSVYFATDDATATSEAIERAGGKVVVPPTLMTLDGRYLIATDPTGAHLRLWESRGFTGAAVMWENESFAFPELMADDAMSAAQFYTDVFGLDAVRRDDGYVMLSHDDAFAAGVLPKPSPEIVNAWEVYFTVADVDAAAARAHELGAAVLVPPTDVAPGRFAALRDPQGAVFHVWRSAEPTT